jgi:hypothetical protein
MALMRPMIAAALLLWTATSALAQPANCTFQLGFATLHDLIPDVVGGCVANERHDATTGDALQQTTSGLLVWRKPDNWTAFTDGSQTWINGPLGLQQRSNDQRFFWEANPDRLAIVPPPQPGERCHTAGLSLTLLGVDVGAGNLVGTFHLTNNLDVSCSFLGFPGAQLLDDAGDAVRTTVDWGGGRFSGDPPPSSVVVQPHTAAMFRIHWEQIPVGNETMCSMASQLAVTPPDEFDPLTVRVAIRACGGGHLDVSAVQPATAARQTTNPT